MTQKVNQCQNIVRVPNHYIIKHIRLNMILILAEMFSLIRVIATSLFTTANAKDWRRYSIFFSFPLKKSTKCHSIIRAMLFL
jgi:hypothetical protein